MPDFIEDGYDAFRDLHPVFQILLATGATVSTARFISRISLGYPSLGALSEILALPFDLVYGVAGDIIGLVLPGLEAITDDMNYDYDNDGTKEGPLGEVFG